MLDSERLAVQDNILITSDTDERAHKANCERSLTFLHQHQNCVVTIEMADKMNINQNQPLAPLSLSNLQESVLEDHVDGLHFD